MKHTTEAIVIPTPLNCGPNSMKTSVNTIFMTKNTPYTLIDSRRRSKYKSSTHTISIII